MSISNRIVVAEAAVGAVLATVAVALTSPGDLWIGSAALHPAWIAVLVLAGRYGMRGLLISLATTTGALAAMNLALGGSLTGLWERTTNTSDLLALAAAILVAWIAMLHETRIGRLSGKLSDSEGWRRGAEEIMAALRDTVAQLRARHDRIDRSLTVWRDIAGRLDSGEPVKAAKAALELCAIQAGAGAGTLQWWDGTALRAVRCSTREPASDLRPHDISVDRTAKAAVELRRPMVASDVSGVAAEDCDLAVPILDEHGPGVIGVIALHGIAANPLGRADLRTLTMVAEWLAPTLALSVRSRRPRLVLAGAGS